MITETSSALASSGAFSDGTTGIAITPDQTGPDAQGSAVISGTFTSATFKVEIQLPGSSVWSPVALIDRATNLKSNTSAAPTNSTTTCYRFDCAGAAGVRAYFSAGTITSGVITLCSGTTEEFGGVLPTLQTTVTDPTSFSSGISLADSASAKFGDGNDILFTWDGTDFDVTQATANSSIKWGVSGAGIDHVFYGDTAGYNLTWDQSADSLIFADNTKLAIGTDSDLTITWDGTDIDVLCAADNTTLTWGASGNSFDWKIFGADANGYLTFDASANVLKLEDSVELNFGSTTPGVGTKGDVQMRWDATDFDILAAADDTILKIGNGTNSFDLWLFGNTASTYVSWDASADSLKLEDSCYLGFGTNTAGPGTKGDINITWNGTKLLVAQTTVNSAIDWGVDGAGIDQVWYGDTASTNMTWDQSADTLLFTGTAYIAGQKTPTNAQAGGTYTVLVTDSGKIITTRGASGASTITLPTVAAGLTGVDVVIFNAVDQDLTVTCQTANQMICFNDLDADAIAFTTAGEKIGAAVRCYCDGTSWLVMQMTQELQTSTVTT